MLGRYEFYDHVKDHLTDYLPAAFAGAKVDLREKLVNYDEEMVGISVMMPGEIVAPVIYLDDIYDAYRDDVITLDVAMERVADMAVKAHEQSIADLHPEQVMDYGFVKDKLQVRLFDTEKNQKKLQDLVHYSIGDLTCAYSVQLSETQDHSMSVMVTPQLMDAWGINKRQLHETALVDDMARGATLNAINELLESMMTGGEPTNYLDEDAIAVEAKPDFEELGGLPLMCLSNTSKLNGAAMIVNPKIQEEIARVMGGNYYVLPSSVHEVLVLPESESPMRAEDLGEMVKTINETQVEPKDRLSDKVQFYDAESRTLMNAMEYQMTHVMGRNLSANRKASI